MFVSKNCQLSTKRVSAKVFFRLSRNEYSTALHSIALHTFTYALFIAMRTASFSELIAFTPRLDFKLLFLRWVLKQIWEVSLANLGFLANLSVYSISIFHQPA